MNQEALNALDGMCNEADQANPAAQQQAAEQAQAEEQAESAGDQIGTMIYAAGSMGSAFVPKLSTVFTKDQCRLVGHAVVPVAEKYNWNMVGKGLPVEAMLAMAVAPMLYSTYVVMNDWLEEKREKRRLAAIKKSQGDNTSEPAGTLGNGFEGDANHGG